MHDQNGHIYNTQTGQQILGSELNTEQEILYDLHEPSGRRLEKEDEDEDSNEPKNDACSGL